MRDERSFAAILLICLMSMKLPKLSVVGSIPIARSKLYVFGWQASRAAAELTSRAFCR